MKAEQAKLQSQLNEFVKKQADYEEVCVCTYIPVTSDC